MARIKIRDLPEEATLTRELLNDFEGGGMLFSPIFDMTGRVPGESAIPGNRATASPQLGKYLIINTGPMG